MKRIGLIGGMSWQSTSVYYRLLNQLARERLGGLHSAECSVHSVDFAEIARCQSEGRWEEAGVILGDAARALERGGADLLLICAHTMHKVADQVAASVGIPLLHLGDVVAEVLRAENLQRVGMLGTAFTMEQGFYRDRLATWGLEVLVPDAEDRATVHRLIYEELAHGLHTQTARASFRTVMRTLAAEGAQAVVLGCTELEGFLTDDDSPVPVIATTALHAAAAVTAALEE
jgi:aspartate racemase